MYPFKPHAIFLDLEFLNQEIIYGVLGLLKFEESLTHKLGKKIHLENLLIPQKYYIRNLNTKLSRMPEKKRPQINITPNINKKLHQLVNMYNVSNDVQWFFYNGSQDIELTKRHGINFTNIVDLGCSPYKLNNYNVVLPKFQGLHNGYDEIKFWVEQWNAENFAEYFKFSTDGLSHEGQRYLQDIQNKVNMSRYGSAQLVQSKIKKLKVYNRLLNEHEKQNWLRNTEVKENDVTIIIERLESHLKESTLDRRHPDYIKSPHILELQQTSNSKSFITHVNSC